MSGLDIAHYYDDLCRIVTSKFGRKTSEVEDLIQNVCLKILTANSGEAPYDPQKGAATTYIYVVAKSVFYDSQRTESPEIVELETESTESCEVDTSGFETYLKKNLASEVLPRRVYLLLKMGYTREEVCQLLDTSLYQVKQQKETLKEQARRYLLLEG